MKRLLLIMLSLLLVLFAGCSGGSEAPTEPSEGVVFAIENTEDLAFDVYEVQLTTPGESGFTVITLVKNEGYQVRWAQSLVDEEQGNSYMMTAYKSEDPAGPNLDRPLSEARELVFTEGSTSEGRLVLIQVSE